ncbi:MAG: hypothetical protein RSB42_03075, partial [Comamonas sp.]
VDETMTGTAVQRPSSISGREVTIITGAGSAQEPPIPDQYEDRDMGGFISGWGRSYASASIKLLIGAIGAKELRGHLESFKAASQNAEERSAADQFIKLIDEAYAARGTVWTNDFLKSLQNLAPFNQRNAAGEWAFKLDQELFSGEKEPEKFLPLLSELFHLDTLPGWSFDVQETYVHQGQERAQERARNRFQLFQPVDLGRIKPEDVASLNLQKLVDLLHAQYEAQVQWNPGDAALTAVKVIRQVRIPDAEQFKRLTISVQGGLPNLVTFNLDDTVTLQATDQKTGQKLAITMTGKQAITWNNSRYEIRIKNQKGLWVEHDESAVSQGDETDRQDQLKMINFAVTKITPLS